METGLVLLSVSPSACELCQAALIEATLLAAETPGPGNPFGG